MHALEKIRSGTCMTKHVEHGLQCVISASGVTAMQCSWGLKRLQKN